MKLFFSKMFPPIPKVNNTSATQEASLLNCVCYWISRILIGWHQWDKCAPLHILFNTHSQLGYSLQRKDKTKSIILIQMLFLLNIPIRFYTQILIRLQIKYPHNKKFTYSAFHLRFVPEKEIMLPRLLYNAYVMYFITGCPEKLMLFFQKHGSACRGESNSETVIKKRCLSSKTAAIFSQDSSPNGKAAVPFKWLGSLDNHLYDAVGQKRQICLCELQYVWVMFSEIKNEESLRQLVGWKMQTTQLQKHHINL